jgi:Protein of unknown function (DUF3268).
MAEANQITVTCPYCNRQARLVNGSQLYPHRPDLHSKQFYACLSCDAYVGCHPDTTRPLGRLANAELRAAKIAAHAAFDPLWRSGPMKRSHAYDWLATALGIPRHKCHIGGFNVEECKRVVEVCQAYAKETAS